MPQVAFVLVKKAKAPAPKKVVATALRLGIQLALDSDRDGTQIYKTASDEMFFVALMPAPHPDAPGMATGPTSVSQEEIASCHAHLIATLMSPEPSERVLELRTAALVAAVIEASDAVGAMFGHGVVFHKAKLFADLAKLAHEQGELPCELAVDVTVARESATHMSFLTHGLARQGREELYVIAPITGRGAAGFVYDLARWMLSDREKQFKTGETVGRTADEKIPIERVPNPTGDGPEVICLRMG